MRFEPKFPLCTVVSGNSTVDLLVVAFFSKCGTFFAKIALCRPSTILVEKVRMVATC